MLVRIPGATAAELEASNRYVDATRPISVDLAALGIPAGALPGLDGLLAGFLWAGHGSGWIKVDRGEYSELALAIDRLIMRREAVAPEAAAE